jgi:DNA-binding NarL/FixJ family response regulator
MPSPSVLIVDASADNREVLRTVLSRRGMHVFEADAAVGGLRLAEMHQPDVVVLDADAVGPGSPVPPEQFTHSACGSEKSVIILGKIRRGPQFAGGHVISKPYHFAPLVHTIERLAAKAA